METLNTHFLLTVYILYKRTKFPSNIVFTSQSHKVTYFYDVGSTYAIDQKINHLHEQVIAKTSLKHKHLIYVLGWSLHVFDLQYDS
jgi:hypothetical protein